MTPAELQQVRSTPLFAHLNDAQLDCLEGGQIVQAPPGTVLAAQNERNISFHVILEGEVRITRDYDRQTVLMKVAKPGDYFGEIMLLLDTPWGATVRVTKPARLFQLDEQGFWRMLTGCQTVAREVFHAAATRVRSVEEYTQQREKLISLGTMAAGLAHELNNPAAAVRRAAEHLDESSDKIQSFFCQLTRTLNHDQVKQLATASQEALDRAAQAPALSDLERSDRAEAVSAWLQSHGAAAAWDIAPIFVQTGIETGWLDQFAGRFPAASHPAALGWLAARLNLKSLLGQLMQSTGRISDLVKAVKSYSYMDQSSMQEIDIHEGIESTLVMLGHRLKNVTLVRAFDRSLPRVMANGGELNQVWTNLIDNAIQAVQGKGRICVGTSREDDHIVVEVVDDGPGIPDKIQSRVFEPFFTTKPVGTGTGLGLIISNRIVADRHGGEIEFESHPGETRFKVRLPISQKK